MITKEARAAPDPGSTRSDAGDSPLAVRCVRALMERHGLPKYRQSAWLADATGLSYSQAHRRMNGASPWTLEEIERVAALFGESLSQVIALGTPSDGQSGVMKVGTASLPCQLWIGARIERPPPDAVVAVQTDSGWSAMVAADAPDAPLYKVDRLDVRPGDATRPVIAVLDDDHDLTHTICAHLEDSGYDARPFFRTPDLLSSAKARRYDGYVIDWIVGESSTQKLIAQLRAQDEAAPIVVLTAQVLAGVVDEAEIAEAVKRFDLVFSEKPVRMSILSATLSRAVAARASRT